MPNDESRPDRGQVPQAWQPALTQFEEMLEQGASPDFSACLQKFSGEVEPLVAELVATYQSFHAVPGNDASHALADLLHTNPRWRMLISQAVGELSTQQIAREAAAPDDSVDLPRKLGRYLLVESLGKGGFSEVFLGCVPNSAEFVVIKVPRQDISRNDLAKEALRQEKNALLQLRGLPGVAKFIDWHEENEGTLALVTEFEQARPLDHVCESEEHSSARIIAWMTTLCEIVQAAHKTGVHHCDLKPQNVLVAEKTDQPILIDFGLAQTLLRWSRKSAAPAASAGTLHYLAPELLDESHEAVPRLVDMFGLGALLYYLMSGSAPFRATDQAAARNRVASCDIDFTMLDNGACAEELKDICRRAMAKEPRERYQSPQALLSALRSVPLPESTSSTAVRKFTPKKSMALVFAGSLLVLGGMVFSQSKFGDYGRSYAVSQPNADQIAPSFVDRSPSPGKSEVENPTPVNHEDEKIAARQEVEEVPSENEPSQEEQAIAQRPESQAIEHKVAKIPLQQLKEFPVIGPRDITVSCIAACRDMVPWGTVDENLINRGKLVVHLATRFQGISEPLQYRFAGNAWSTLKRSQDRYTANLGLQEIVGNRLEIAVGDVDAGFLAGPFTYRQDYQLVIDEDQARFVDELLKEACEEKCFELGPSWTLSKRFVERYRSIIREFRFGVSLAEPLIRMSLDKGQPARLPASKGGGMTKVFAKLSKPVQSNSLLWTEIDFINDVKTGPRQHHRYDENDFQQAMNTRRKLARNKESPMGAMIDFNFVPHRLSIYDSALTRIEIGETAEEFTISVQVVSDSKDAGLDSLLKRPHPVLRQSQSVRGLLGYQIPALYVRKFRALNTINVPPIWKGVYYRGVFKDGSYTDTYYADNQSIAPGFEMECISAKGCPRMPAYAIARWNEKSDPSKSIVSHLKIDKASFTDKQMALLYCSRLNAYAELPPGAAWFEHFADPELIHSQSEFTPGYNYTLFLDRYGRKVGVCTYYVDEKKARNTIFQLANDTESPRPDPGVNDWKAVAK